MKSILNKFIGMLLLTMATFGHAGTYDGSYYTDQQRINMMQSYADSIYSSGAIGSVESITKYQDTRLLNGKKGYMGSILVVRPDAYIKSTNSSSVAFRSSKEFVVHIFDRSVVGSYNVADGGADCRSFTSPTRTSCWGDGAKKNIGLVTHIEVKKDNPFNSGVTISTQYSQEQSNSAVYYNAYRTTGTTTRVVVQSAGVTSFNDTTLEMGLIYNALQNSDGTFPTKEVLLPPMDYTIVDPVPLPVAPVATQDCSNPNASNTTNSSICLIGQVIEGCKLTTGNYLTTINSVAGNVGLTAVDVRITCSTGTPFHIKPIHDHIQLAGDDETLKLTGWKDNGRADKLTPLSAKVINGTGSEMSIPIYFTLEGKGKSGIYGNSVVNKYTGSAVYPIQIVY